MWFVTCSCCIYFSTLTYKTFVTSPNAFNISFPSASSSSAFFLSLLLLHLIPVSLLAQHSLPSCLPPFNLPAAVFSHLCLSPHLLSISFPPSFPLSSFFPPIFPCPPSLSCPLHQFLNLCFLFFFTFLSIILPFSSLSHFFSPPFLFVTLILCLFSLPLHFLVISLTSHVLSPPLTFFYLWSLSLHAAFCQRGSFPEPYLSWVLSRDGDAYLWKGGLVTLGEQGHCPP